LKKQQKLQVDRLLFHENMLQRLKLFSGQCKIFGSKKVKQLGHSFTEILERCYNIQHMWWNEKNC